jgi:hypothetical protein
MENVFHKKDCVVLVCLHSVKNLIERDSFSEKATPLI